MILNFIDRKLIFKDFIEGKKVLDVGCLGNGSITDFHQFVEDNASYTLGIDINESLINKAKSKWNVIYGNAENYIANEKFDVIVASEILEHLSNPGNFFECSYKNLKDGGILILSTPNSFGIHYILNKIRKTELINIEHVCWYDEFTLKNFAARYGFCFVMSQFVDLTSNYIKKITLKFFPDLADTIIIVFQKISAK